MRTSFTQIAWVGGAQVAAMALWFSATAVLPALRTAWSLNGVEAAWVTAAVQVGFALGALASALLQLADRMDPRRLFAVGALLGGASTVALATVTVTAEQAILLRFCTGICLAAVYPPGMKLAASHAEPRHRGVAIGALVGALTLGSALPHLVRYWLAGGHDGTIPWRLVLLASAGLAVAAALVMLFVVRRGPYAAQSAPFEWSRVGGVLRDPRLRRLHAAYCGHMWELYALWTWVGAWLVAVRGGASEPADGLLLFGTMGVSGAVAAVWAGRLADRVGRYSVARRAMAGSSICCLLSPWVASGGVGWSLGLAAFLAIWGATVIADSAQFSAATTEVCAPDAMGTALTLQTCLGFSVTLVTIHGLPMLAEWVGWEWAMASLAIGPAAGVVWLRSMRAVAE